MDLSNDSQIFHSQIAAKNEEEKYKKIKVLGEGSMGKVYLVQCNQEDEKGNLYVMKRINIGHLQPKQKEQALQQAQLHNMVSHQNIIAFKQIYHTTKDKLCIIMQYAEGGDLDQLLKEIKQNKKHLSQDQILKYFVQICLALKEIHDKKIVHRDLKGANIFIGKNDTIKIGDFGISKAMDKTVLASKSFVGTPFYLSPEMVQGKPYSTKADIWALGVILYNMVALKLPFDANSLPVLALKILKGSYPQISGNQYSRQLKSLITSMLQVDQKRRPNVNDILNKPILAKYLPKGFIKANTPKIKPKVQIKSQKIKLATNKSRKQILLQNNNNLSAQQKLLKQQEAKQKRQEQRIKRDEQRKQMYQDLKEKRLQVAKQQNQKLQAGSQSANIPKKQPSSNKLKGETQKKAQITKVQAKVPMQKPWKNKNLKKQTNQPVIDIRLPVQRKKQEKIQEENLPKGKDFDVQIFVAGQNPYKTTAMQNLNKNSNMTSRKDNSKLVVETSPQFYIDESSQVEQKIEKKKNYDDNLQDLLANVQRANDLVGNLSNPYEKNNIELYEESQSFDTTIIDNYNKEKKKKEERRFQNNESDAENMKFITDITSGQNLQQLRSILEERLGQQGFIKAHQIVRDHFETSKDNLQKDNINTEETDPEQKESYLFNRIILREKLNFLTKEQFDRNIQLLYTISVMEDMEMMRNFQTESSEDYQEQNDNQT